MNWVNGKLQVTDEEHDQMEDHFRQLLIRKNLREGLIAARTSPEALRKQAAAMFLDKDKEAKERNDRCLVAAGKQEEIRSVLLLKTSGSARKGCRNRPVGDSQRLPVDESSVRR